MEKRETMDKKHTKEGKERIDVYDIDLFIEQVGRMNKESRGSRPGDGGHHIYQNHWHVS